MDINIKPIPYYTGTKIIDDNDYQLTIRWNTHTSKWYMDLVGVSNTVDIKNIALLPGIDLLLKFGYSELGELWMVDNSGANEPPDFDNVGGRFTLEYTPKA